MFPALYHSAPDNIRTAVNYGSGGCKYGGGGDCQNSQYRINKSFLSNSLSLLPFYFFDVF